MISGRVEKRDKIIRLNISFVLSIIIHLILFLLLFLLGINRPEQVKLKVIKLNFSSAGNGSVSDKSGGGSGDNKVSSGRTSMENSAASNNKKTPDKNEKSIQTQERSVPNENQGDNVAEYIEKSKSDNKRIEDEFFKSGGETSGSAEKTSGSDVDDLLGGLEGESGGANIGQSNDAGGSGGGGISWESGGVRSLRYSKEIVLPDTVSRSGKKFTVEIEFSVISSGHIVRSRIVRSSGNAEWDEIIRTQFMEWSFEPVKTGISSGSIIIEIAY